MAEYLDRGHRADQGHQYHFRVCEAKEVDRAAHGDEQGHRGVMLSFAVHAAVYRSEIQRDGRMRRGNLCRHTGRTLYPNRESQMKNAVVYIHGKDGIAAESEHYKPLFPGCDVIGLDYKTFTPWETGKEIKAALEKLKAEYDNIILIANSIGAFFAMNAGIDSMIEKAYFISPIVDMGKLITNMMIWANINEDELKDQGVMHTSFGEDLSWEYLCYVRSHPIRWDCPTAILYGRCDDLTSFDTISAFTEKHHADLTVMENGGHWFHTEEQMRFLDDWINTGEGTGE